MAFAIQLDVTRFTFFFCRFFIAMCGSTCDTSYLVWQIACNAMNALPTIRITSDGEQRTSQIDVHIYYLLSKWHVDNNNTFLVPTAETHYELSILFASFLRRLKCLHFQMKSSCWPLYLRIGRVSWHLLERRFFRRTDGTTCTDR